MAKVSQEKIRKSTKHEDKIANVLQNMKNRRNRDRLSSERQAEDLSAAGRKNKSKVQVKTVSKLNLKTKTDNNDKRNGKEQLKESPKLSKRQRVPTEKILALQKNTKQGTKVKAVLEEISKVKVSLKKENSAKPKGSPEVVSSKRERVPTSKLKSLQEAEKKKSEKKSKSEKRDFTKEKLNTQDDENMSEKKSSNKLPSAKREQGKKEEVDVGKTSKRERVPTNKFLSYKNLLKDDEMEKSKGRADTKKVVPKETLKRKSHEDSESPAPKLPKRERVPTSKYLSYQDEVKAETKSFGSKKQELDKTVIKPTETPKKEIQAPVKTAPLEKLKPKQKSQISSISSPVKENVLEKFSDCPRKLMMDKILENHYSNNKIFPTKTVKSASANNAPLVPKTPTSAQKDYFYIRIDDEISVKSPVRTPISIKRSSSAPSVINKKVTEELSKYKKIAPKATSPLAIKPNINEPKTDAGDSYIPCNRCGLISKSIPGYHNHVLQNHKVQTLIKEFLHFPNFLGFNCSLLGSKYQAVTYYVTEVRQPKKNQLFQMPENLSETCLFFVPHVILSQFPDLKMFSNIYIPYICHTKGFAAYFPNSCNTLQVSWATNLQTAEMSVNNREMFILTKSRFKLIQSVRGGRDSRSFCKMLDQDQLQIENLIKMQTDTMLHMGNSTAQEVTPQVSLSTYKCPFQDCGFVSDRKYGGVRNHLLKHFKDNIEEEAKPRAFLTDREKSNCMSQTGCSVPVLANRGELVHHFGIFHCLIDDLFQEFAMLWMKSKHKEYAIKNQCPYEDYTYSDENDFLRHLSTAHFFNGILSEVEDMVKFSLSFFESYNCMANIYKCPFCKKKFRNLADGPNVRDVKEMVIHCGVEHGFALYYLMSDDKMEEMRTILRIKEEPVEIEEEENNKTGDDDISNYLQVEMQE